MGPLRCLCLYSPHTPGIYVCAKCGYELFSSRAKYAHSSPWPAFTETIHADSVAKRLEHGRSQALKVGDSDHSWGLFQGVPENQSHLPCFSHNSWGFQAVYSRLLALAWGLPPHIWGQPSVLVEPGCRDVPRPQGEGQPLTVGLPSPGLCDGPELTWPPCGLPRCPVADVAMDWAMNSWTMAPSPGNPDSEYLAAR